MSPLPAAPPSRSVLQARDTRMCGRWAGRAWTLRAAGMGHDLVTRHPKSGWVGREERGGGNRLGKDLKEDGSMEGGLAPRGLAGLSLHKCEERCLGWRVGVPMETTATHLRFQTTRRVPLGPRHPSRGARPRCWQSLCSCLG